MLARLASASRVRSIVAYTLRQPGHRVRVFVTGAVIRALAQRRLDYGYLRGPRAGRQIQYRDDVVLIPQTEPTDRWNVAIALRTEDRTLHHRLNGAIPTPCRRRRPHTQMEGRWELFQRTGRE